MVRLRSATWVLGAQVLSLLVSFPMSILLARTLGPSGKGELTLAQLVATVGATVACVGLPSATTYLAARREASAGAALRLSAGVAAVALGVIAVAWLGFGRLLESQLHLTASPPVVLGAIALVPVLIGLFMGGYLIGVGQIRNSSLINIATLVIQLVLYAALAALHRLTAMSAIVVWIGATSASALALASLSLATREPAPASRRSGLDLARRGYRYGLASWVAGALGILVLRIDVLLLSAIRGTAEVGVYSISVTFAELLFYVPTALNTVLLPKVASEGRGDESHDLVARGVRSLWPFTLASGLVLGLAATLFVPLLYGSRFSGSIVGFWYLVPGTAFSALTAPVTAFFGGTGRPREAVLANSVNLVVNIGLNLVLIPRLGVPGAALSSTVSYGVGALIILMRFNGLEGVPWRTLLVPRLSDAREAWDAAIAALKQRAAIGPAEETV